MTITNARERFGLKENDTIYADGIKALMETTKQSWSRLARGGRMISFLRGSTSAIAPSSTRT